MATFTSPAAFANHVAGYGDKIKTATPRAVAAAALAATNDIRSEASGFHIGRAKLRAGYDLAGAVAIIKPKNPGAWKLIEEGANTELGRLLQEQRITRERFLQAFAHFLAFKLMNRIARLSHPITRLPDSSITRCEVS